MNERNFIKHLMFNRSKYGPLIELEVIWVVDDGCVGFIYYIYCCTEDQ